MIVLLCIVGWFVAGLLGAYIISYFDKEEITVGDLCFYSFFGGITFILGTVIFICDFITNTIRHPIFYKVIWNKKK